MYEYPMIFKANNESKAGMNTVWKTRVPNGELTAALPPEFAGPGGGFSPEDFFVLAVVNCFVATFKVIAQNSKIEFESIKCESTLTVGPNERGQPEFKSVHVKAILKGMHDAEKATRVLEKTSKACLVANSLKIDKIFEFEVI